MSDEHLKGKVEALLFSSGRAMSEDALSSILDTDPKDIKKALKQLKKDYDERETVLKIFEDNKTWRMLIHDDYVEVARKVVADTELGRATLETLAVIAYRHPKALQSEVVNTRGSTAYEHIRELEEAGFIVRAKEGRSFSIKLTEKFFEYFDVTGDRDIKDVFANVQPPIPKEHQKKLGDLNVVSVLPETKQHDEEEANKEIIDGMEVVDVAEKEEPADIEEDNPFMKRQLGNAPEMTDEERETHRNFLDDLDNQINSLSAQNDEHDQDELFKRPLPAETEGGDVGDDVGDDVGGDAGETAEPASGEAKSTESCGTPKKSALDEPLDLDEL